MFTSSYDDTPDDIYKKYAQSAALGWRMSSSHNGGFSIPLRNILATIGSSRARAPLKKNFF